MFTTKCVKLCSHVLIISFELFVSMLKNNHEVLHNIFTRVIVGIIDYCLQCLVHQIYTTFCICTILFIFVGGLKFYLQNKGWPGNFFTEWGTLNFFGTYEDFSSGSLSVIFSDPSLKSKLCITRVMLTCVFINSSTT